MTPELAAYDTYLRKMINRTKFDVCTPSGVGGAKTDRHTDQERIALCSIDTF